MGYGDKASVLLFAAFSGRLYGDSVLSQAGNIRSLIKCIVAASMSEPSDYLKGIMRPHCLQIRGLLFCQ